MQLGDSTKARVGDWVIAIGNPFGLGGTVTAGIISALHRGITGGGAYDRYIQTDAAINMGNCGGPMFDLNGNVIGINSALISPTGASVGIGLAIPAELAKPVIDALMKRPAARSAAISASASSRVDEDLAPGARHSQGQRRDRPLGRPERSGGARRARQQGDVIVKVNGQQVTPDQTVSYLVANTPVGSRVPLEIIRGGKRATVYVQVGERPTEEALAKISGGDSGQLGHCPGRAGNGAAEGARPLACTADAGARARGEPAGERARRDHHRRRSQQRRRRAGTAARRPHRVGQQPAGDDAWRR